MADGVADMFDDQSSDNGYSSGEDRRRNKKPGASSNRRRQYSDDDEDDEDEIDGGGRRGRGRRSDTEDSEDYEYIKKKPARKKKKRARANNFLDIEASVDTDEEEDEEDDGALGDFIVDNEAELASAEKDALRHRSAMRAPAGVFADDDSDEALDGEALEARLRARYSGYGDTGRAAAGGGAAADGDWVPQRLLIPGVRDPHLWVCACLQGKERDIVLASARRVFQWHGKGKFDGVYSAFCRDGLSGHVYVEAHSLAEARDALEGIPGVFVSKLALVPLGDMVDVVKIKARAPRINPGAWVRVRRGNYAGDLAQVVAVIEAADTVEVRLVPRLDYDGSTGKGERPAPRLFSADEARRSDSRSLSSRQNEIMWRGDRFVGGYLHKDMRVAGLTLHAAPTLDEITRFAGDSGDGDGDDGAAIAALAAAAAAADIGGPVAARDLQPGDAVEVVDGDLAGVVGVVSSVDGDIVRVSSDVGARRAAPMSFAPHQLRKRFAAGDHVKVLAGRHSGATGMVLVASDSVVTVHADVGGAELRVLARDLRLSSDVSGAGGHAQALVGLDVHDLVLLDGALAVVTRVASDALTVLDDRGETRTVPPRDARPARSSADRAGVDCAGAPLRRGDAVREISGARREGSVLQVTRFVAFVLPRGSGALFVTRTRQLEPANTRGAALAPYATRAMRPPQPGARGGRGGRAGAMRGGRDPLVGKTVVANRGPFKGYIGIVKDTTGDSVRVEFHTNAKMVNMDRDKLSVRMPSGDTVPAADFGNTGALPPPPPAAAAAAAAAAASGGYANTASSRDRGASASNPYSAWGAPSPAPARGASSGWDARSPAAAAGGSGWDARSPAATATGYPGWDAGAASSASWDTPANTGSASNGWGDASSNPTPAATTGWDASAAGSISAATSGWAASPAPVTPGGLPQTPGGLPQTPGSSSYDAPTPHAPGRGEDGFFAWAVPRAMVVLASTRQRGTLIEVSAARHQAIVRMEEDGSTQVIDRASLSRLDPQPVRAEKRDRVIVVRGPRRGATGTMVGRDGSEAFFQADGDSTWHPEPLRNLTIYGDSSNGRR
ncbi:transcription elongation factor spt5 [Coemansia sp. BCRC 34962]|nr:transcription elongation factor spt5 [Coemansia sp. BCRC 34962]